MRGSTRRDYRGVGKPVGAVIMGLGIATFLCGGVGWAWDAIDPLEEKPTTGTAALFVTGCVALIAGAFAFQYGKRHESPTVSRREAVLAVVLIWISAGLVGAVPFLVGAGLSPIDAYFEAISGFTTTGATVITDIEVRLSRPLLLWRSLIQWLGGMGIVVLFVAVFPTVGAGGKHMFRGEVPGTTAEGLKPRIRETSFTLWKLYAGFTALEALLLSLLGMEPFEAVCHAFTTMSTGGFSTRDASIGAFERPAFEYLITVFMLLGSVNFGLYYAVLKTRTARVVARNLELRSFVLFVALATVLLSIMNYPVHGDAEVAFRKSFFMVGTGISSTGYVVDDFTTWASPALTIFLMLMIMGGSSGSTAGGMKVERVLLLAKHALSQVKKGYRPSAVQLVRMGHSVVSSQVLGDVGAFFVLYMGTIGLGVFVVTFVDGVPIPTAFGAALTCVANSGPAPFWDMAFEADNFSRYSAISKVFFTGLMLFGRLEFFTVLALFVPGFWRR